MNIAYKYIGYIYTTIMSNKITVNKDYTQATLNPSNTVDIGPRISNYQADYLFIHFDEIMRREIDRNPDIIYDNNFQEFMQYVSEYKRILVESRKHKLVPGLFGSTSEQFSCSTGSHIFTPEDRDKINEAIILGQLNPRKYLTENDLSLIGFNNHYIQECGNRLSHNFFEHVALPTQRVWNNYLLSKSIEPNASITINTYQKLHEDFQKSMADINDQVINGDYATRYNIIEQKISDTVNFLENLISASNTEENIINNTLDLSNYYERLVFGEPNVDPSLVIPKDTIDLVERDALKKQIKASINRYSKMSTSSVLASTYNVASEVQNIRNVGSLATNLLDTLNNANNIINPPQELYDLMSTKLYIDDNGNQVAKYLNDTASNKLIQNEIDKQNSYLEFIRTNETITSRGKLIPVNSANDPLSRLNRYSHKYTYVPIAQGGNNSKSTKYQFNKKSTQNITISQSGGRDIDVEKLLDSSKQASNVINQTISDIDQSRNFYTKQTELYFNNNNFVDIDNLNQRNQLLIEMINVLGIYNFLIGERSNNRSVFLSELDKRTKSFKQILDNYIKSVNSRIPPITDDKTIGQILANGFLSVSEIQNLITTSGLNINVEQIPEDAILNNATTAKLISTLIDKYSLSNMKSVVSDLRKILNVAPLGITYQTNPEDSYKQLSSFYSILKSLNTSLLSEYQNLSTNTQNFQSIRDLTGKILESNISTFNTFTKQLIESVRNFGSEIDGIQSIRKQILQSKRRLADIEFFTRESTYNLSPKSQSVSQQDADLLQSKNLGVAVMNHDLSSNEITDFYQNYVTNYLDKIAGASVNVVKHYSYDKDIKTINDNKNMFNNTYDNYNTLLETLQTSANTTRTLRNIVSNNTTINSDASFNSLARRIWDVINYFNGTFMPLNSDIMNKINIPGDLSEYLSKYLIVNPEIINNYLANSVNFDSTGKIQPTDKLSRKSQIDLLVKTIPFYIKGAQLSDTYTTSQYSPGIPNQTFIGEVQDRLNQLIANETDDNAYNLYNYVTTSRNIILPEARIVGEISDQLEDVYNSRFSTPTNRSEFQNSILSQLDTIIIGIYRQFYETLMYLYQLANNYILINNPHNPMYSSIQKDQHNLAALQQDIRIMNLSNNFAVNGRDIPDIVPKSTGGPINCRNPLINKRFNKTIHRRINCLGLMIIDYNNNIGSDLSTITQQYNTFYQNSVPLLNLLRDQTISGEQINAILDVNINALNLFVANPKLLPNSFTYGTRIQESNMITPNIINTFDINNLDPNKSVFNDYETTLSAYIPSFVNDIIDINGQYIEYTNVRYHLISVGSISLPNVKIQAGDTISIRNIDDIQMLIDIGNNVVDFTNRLYKSSKQISNLVVETVDTWGSSVLTDSDEFNLRRSKKFRLLQTLNTLRHIEDSIRSNRNITRLNQFLLEKEDPTNAVLIMSAISIVNNINLTDRLFNENVDKIWIFARKLVNVWYTIFSQILSLLVVNGVVPATTNLIRSLDPFMRRSNLFNIDNVIDNTPNTNNYVDAINNEFNTKISQINNDKNKYPINLDPSKSTGIPDQDKYIIDNPNIISFNHYYNNISDKSSRVYILMAIMNDEGYRNINKYLESISDHTEYLINLVDFSENYLDNNFIQKKLDDLPIIDPKITNLVNAQTNFKQAFMLELQLELQALGLDQLYGPIESLVNNGTNTIQTGLSNPKTITPVAILDPNRSIEIDNQVSLDIISSPRIFDPSEYLYLANEFITSRQSGRFFRLYLSDIYRVIFRSITNELDRTMNSINQDISATNVADLEEFRETYLNYITNKKFSTTLYLNPTDLSDSITAVPNDSNSPNIKAVLLLPNDYQTNSDRINTINDIFRTVSETIKPNIYELFETEISNYNKLIQADYTVRKLITDYKSDVQNKLDKLRNIRNVISQVMFDNYFKQYAFISNGNLMTLLENTIENYETIWQLIEQKIYSIVNKNNYHILTMSQINNYQAFKSAINKLINNQAIIKKFYKRMSFGLIEYYYDIMDSLVVCLESKNFEDMSDIEAYIYQYHYVQLKRCHALFRWIRQEYQRNKQAQDDVNSRNITPGTKYNRILDYKIELLKTTGDVNSVFLEFQGLRRYLDEYSAIAMDKVQLHLRINDFVSNSYNNELNTLSNGRDISYMLDTDPNSNEYKNRWDNKQLMFINQGNSNNLKINFDLLQKIYQFNNPSSPPRDFEAYYTATYRRMKNNQGIDFQRIYNTNVFPESDVISNYMSIAPNILNNKGTVIMTYGYSGVGKSASLFGRKMDLSRGVDKPSNGILQATLDQLTNVEIYFRVFEIYGLGTQYNYYWNPTENNNYQCYPDFYQCIIHHVLDTTDSTTLKTKDHLVFTNRHDMLAYIMDLQNPKNGTQFTINNKNDPNLSNKTTFFNTIGQMVKSTYSKITEDHYRNFTDFVDDIDRVRSDGIHIKKVFDHIVKQIKGTINNPISSRSILVYDFEINLDPGSSNPIFIPFLIYDLPGKEDISRTYVDTSITPAIQGSSIEKINLRRRVFKDIDPPSTTPGVHNKERKSTYVLNPLLIPVFDNNIQIITDILGEISSKNTMISRLDVNFEATIVTDILNFVVDNFGVDNKGENVPSVQYPMNSFYKNPGGITTLVQLLSDNELIDTYKSTRYADVLPLIIGKGILSVNIIAGNRTYNPNENIKEIKILIGVVIIGHLIKYRLFDVVVEIINRIVEGPGNPNQNDDGGWSVSKIYAFFEAYYINENVVGLLQYLITNVLNKSSNSSGILEQVSTINNNNIKDTISQSYRTANAYSIIKSQLRIYPKTPLPDDYNIKVNSNLLVSSDVLKTLEIKEFMDNNDIQPDGQFFTPKVTPITELARRMDNVISFENRSDYDNNRIFRSGSSNFNCYDSNDVNDKILINPRRAIFNTAPSTMTETNRPLLQDFIEPYEQKISFYYIFYVVSNSQSRNKAEEQVKLLNNSMPFIDKMDPVSKKKQCV
ncbi:kinesin-like protein [Acanthamoeba castellanii mimivirus]|uniref:Uncharacterized protein L294 n=7 Tax=Mimivirus TaxID=315393 RepID=YL294_MIMIV|nr:kinesin-like protein [Acanthamoeba polyphaga mimivirus]Q5UPY0.1 RecName: Full=Uncharacterized protein L294 [Acanthamoeba polyphaga mimivirus]BAV61393.1 kinesin-like protein [Acanthamoeba castellanii mimivirus]AAV50566.1 unknown [Acanthamoeba polyphaga mimivirus]ADO18123.1 kinesin-like protein [Acanthamoeba polyphaga mimivirus]UTE96154.1 kinesin-like protein MIMI-L294 [Acanthamoeba polyphaga mimivirus]BAV62381.1 kinesin-like protein [Acanthamoeba castellanii mimivirus]